MMNTDSNPIFVPTKLGPIELRNRVIKAATFEGMAIDNMVTDALIDFHKAFAIGRIGMTTLAYCAVSPDGQGAPNEIVMRKEAAWACRPCRNRSRSPCIISIKNLLKNTFQKHDTCRRYANPKSY